MKGLLITVTIAAFAATAQAAAADYERLWKECAQAHLDIVRYVRATQACSDAAFKRNDIDEADAICMATHVYNNSFGPKALSLLSADNDPTTDVAHDGCVKTQVRPLGDAYMKAISWMVAYFKVRLDGKGRDTIRPLVVSLPKD